MRKKDEPNIEHSLRLIGLKSEEEINNQAFFLKMLIDQEAYDNFRKELSILLSGAYEDLEFRGLINADKIRQALSIIDKMTKPEMTSASDAADEMSAKQDDPAAEIRDLFNLKTFKVLKKISGGLKMGTYLLSAQANVGKSAFLIQLALDILDSNPDAMVFFYSLDDTNIEILRRLVSCQSYYLTAGEAKFRSVDDAIAINFTDSYYDYFDEYNQVPIVDENKRQLKKASTAVIKGYLKQQRLILKDSEQTVDSIRADLSSFRDKKKVLIIDAVYNLETNEDDDFKSDKKIAKALAKISRNYKVPVICVKDQSKSAGDGSNKTLTNVKGNGQWGYEAKLVLNLFTKDYKTVEFTVMKNKLTDYRTPFQLKLHANKSVYTEDAYIEVKKEPKGISGMFGEIDD